MDNNSVEQAIPLLLFDPVKKIFTLSQQGEELLRNTKGEFAVISVAGMYRTGKSYLLNQMLLNRSKGFSVGPTVNPCTKGLWIWNKPILGLDNNSNTKIPIFLIDTEGFGAFDEDQNHDIKIFTLAILLSSYFIYNSMGSIDENAIQSLSFVINLSKSIQLKGKFENDPEELASLFPSFLWLVRDFSLQLVDDDGDTITPKEYLEKVLDTSKSNFDIDDKTKIRKLIKTFFKDRDCHTMVRPITDENKLQDLQNLPSEKLRPDFVEGIIQLRKKIANKIKPKQLNKKLLNGDMYVNMIKSVIDAINKGAVPNIENTWSSMCKVECMKAYELAESAYENYLRENLGDGLGNTGSINSNEYIQGVYKVAKDNALSLFKKKALGESTEQYIKNLKDVFKERLKFYEEQAEEGSRMEMYKKLKQFFAYFENKIYNPKSSDDEITVEKIDDELKKMEVKINERFGDFKLKTEIFNEFKANVFYFVGEYLKKNNNLQLNQIEKEKEELQKKLAEEIEEHKSFHLKELKKKNTALESLKTELLESKEEQSTMKHKILSLEKDNDILNKICEEKLARQKDDYERKLTEIQKNLILQDEKVREAERKVIQIENEKSKEIALLDQSSKHMIKQIEELKKNEKEFGVELKSQLKEANNALKESNNKYESKIKQLNQMIDQLREELVESDSNYKKSETLLENEKDRNLELEKKLKTLKEETEFKLNQYKKKAELDKSKYIEELGLKEKDNQNIIGKLKLQLEELEIKSKSIQDDLKNQLNKLQREYSVHIQSHEFLEEKNKELNNQLEDQKKNHEAIIQKLESKTFSMIGNDEYNKKLDEIKNFYENEKLQTEESYENQKRLYLKQIDQINESKSEAEVRYKADLDEKQRNISELNSRLEKANREIKQMTNEKKQLSDNFNDVHDEMSEKLKSMIKDGEKRLEDKDYSHNKEMEDLTTKSEDTIKQLRMIYETEKIRLEDKFKEEKSKNEKKLKSLTNEYEEKIKELTDEAQNEYYNLEEEYKALEQRSLNYESQAENEINILKNKCDNLDKNLKELKENFNSAVSNAQKSAEIALEKYEKERKELNDKLEFVNSDNNNKDKEIVLLMADKDRYASMLKEKDEYVNKLRSEIEEEKKELTLRIEEYNKKYQEGHDKFLTEKLEFTKDIAVLKQQIEFSKKKNDDLKEQLEQNQIKFEERLFNLRSEVESDSLERFDKLKFEKADLEDKLLAKKKDLKETEQSFVKQIHSFEREIALLKERLATSESQKDELKENYEKELANISSLSKNLKGDHQKELEEILKNNENQKSKIASLTSELQQAKIQIEKDKVLWENKSRYLELQKDNLKQELSEINKNNKDLMESIQKRHDEDKEKLEKSSYDKYQNMENKYVNQIKEINEKHNIIYSEIFNNNKLLEKELKNLKLDYEIKNKSFDPAASNRKIEELNDQIEKYKTELEQSKKTSYNKINELRQTMEKEKDDLKRKTYDLEARIKEMESKRSNYIFEIELERGKWNNEKEHLNSTIGDLKDQLETITLKNENLTKENVKLKNEKNIGRSNINTSKIGGISSRIGGGVSMGNSSIGGRGTNPYANFASGVGSTMFGGGGKFGNMDKILEADVSNIQNTSHISSTNKDSNFKSDNINSNSNSKFLNKYKAKDFDDSKFSDN